MSGRDFTQFHTLFSEGNHNGVFALNRIGYQTADCHNPSPPEVGGPIGPIGFHMDKHPYSGAPWNPKAPLFYTMVYKNDEATITYQESSEEEELRWLEEVPCAARTLPLCFIHILNASFNESHEEIRSAAQSIISDAEKVLTKETWTELWTAAQSGQQSVDNVRSKEEIISFLTGSPMPEFDF